MKGHEEGTGDRGPGTRDEGMGNGEVGLEVRLGHRFGRVELLEQALSHRSWAFEGKDAAHYERLELLGDSVLGLLATEWLFARHPDRDEGYLAKLKAHLVSESVLAEAARRLDLGAEIRLGIGEERSGGRKRNSLLADVFEAVLGALYLDAGLEPARRLVEAVCIHEEQHPTSAISSDPKTALQELLQAGGFELPIYLLADSTGPDHRKSFVVQCLVRNQLLGLGEGASKKKAEQAAAGSALERLRAGYRLS